MKSESHRNKIQARSRPYDQFIGIWHVLAFKAARVAVATCFAIISSVATTSAETVVLYGNIPDPITPRAVQISGPDIFPSDENVHTLGAQPFFTGELGIVSSISLPVPSTVPQLASCILKSGTTTPARPERKWLP